MYVCLSVISLRLITLTLAQRVWHKLLIFAFVMLLADRCIGIAASASIPYAAYLIYNLFFIDESVAGSTKGLHELVFFQKNAQQSPAPAQSSYKPILAIGANNVRIE
ncbi:hypothetical protein GQX74_002121 [Glossina fuscipes]|nr:hypothetical protein GQX74_002121 [Glossina fuscipes]